MNETNHNSALSVNNIPVITLNGGQKFETESDEKSVESQDFDQGTRLNRTARITVGGSLLAR